MGDSDDDKLIKAFYKKAKKIDFDVLGLYCANKEILTLGSDSKLIGRIFELIASGILTDICNDFNWVLMPTATQTVYPDFTMLDEKDHKIAVDIKTTYRKYSSDGSVRKFGFTLGSFASYLRNDTKNIAFPYHQYKKHYIIGFVYDRVDSAIPGQVTKNENEITKPYTNVEYFIQEKYKIAGEKPGSGNTENIGSIQSDDINAFKKGQGPFSELGKDVFEEYWKGYPCYRKKNNKNSDDYYDCLDDFLKKKSKVRE